LIALVSLGACAAVQMLLAGSSPYTSLLGQLARYSTSAGNKPQDCSTHRDYFRPAENWLSDIFLLNSAHRSCKELMLACS
jgi:hypothetical protein